MIVNKSDCPVIVSNWTYELLEDSDCNVRAHFSTECTAGAFILACYGSGSITLKVYLFSEGEQLARAGNCAEPASLTTHFVNNYFCHEGFPSAVKR